MTPIDPALYENVIFYSMFPSEYTGPALIHVSATDESRSKEPAKLPVIPAFNMGEEYSSDQIWQLSRLFEIEFTRQCKHSPTYAGVVKKRFEQAWQYEDYYEQLIDVWNGWIQTREERIAGFKVTFDERAILSGEFTYQNELGSEATEKDSDSLLLYENQVKGPSEQINNYRHNINNAKAALYLIRQSKSLIEYYEPTASSDAVLGSASIYDSNKGDEQIGLSHSQIAILYHYTKQLITKNNANDIAKRYKQTSGQKLEVYYKDLAEPKNRTSRGKNKVNDIKKVLPLLTGAAKDMAQKELSAAMGNNTKKSNW